MSKKNKIKQSILAIAIGLTLAAGISFAWNGPTANPPGNNAPAPITVQGDDPSTENNEGRQEIIGSKKLVIFDKKDGTKGGGVLQLVGGLRVDGLLDVTQTIHAKGDICTDAGGGVCLSRGGGTSGGFTNFQVFDTPGTTNWTVPVGVTKIMVEVWGGGEGSFTSGNSADDTRYGGGGGGYGKGIFNVASNQTYAVTVGKGGKGGKGSSLDRDGGDSSFGSLISAFGGKEPGQGGKGPSTADVVSIDGEDGRAVATPTGVVFNYLLLGGGGANGGSAGVCGATRGKGKAPGGGGSCEGNGARGRVIVWW